jgi:DNA mismatch repair ATPase MutS
VIFVTGACPKSYGTHVARLAGIPAHIVQRAACISASTETQVKAATAALAGDAHRSENAMDVDLNSLPDQPSLISTTVKAVAVLKQVSRTQEFVADSQLLQKLLTVQAKAKTILDQSTDESPMELA